jgi:hypothetical protein
MLRIFSWVATDYAVELWLRTKVEKESELEIGRPEIVVKLPSCGLVDVPSRFCFNNEPFVYNQVESLGSEFLTLVNNVHTPFPRDSMPPLEKLPLKRHNVEPLEKPESEVVVNLVKRSNHRTGKLPLEKFDARHKQKNAAPTLLQSSKPVPQTLIARNERSGASECIRSIRITPSS